MAQPQTNSITGFLIIGVEHQLNIHIQIAITLTIFCIMVC
jgi:hypothetical protein